MFGHEWYKWESSAFVYAHSVKPKKDRVVPKELVEYGPLTHLITLYDCLARALGGKSYDVAID